MREIYLDNSATTKVDDDTAALALTMMTADYGNPSSLHAKGLAAHARLDGARKQIADTLGCAPTEVVFTSGGTESNNLALLGAAEALKRRGKTLVAMASEHSSVLEPLRRLESQGFSLKLIPPEPDGSVNPDRLLDAVDSDTILVSCMLVNSEVGTIAPIADLAAGLRRKSKLALLHCDAVQAFGKLPFSAAGLGADLVSVSAHKLHAPKGCGALYIRRGVRILPLQYGGGQERGLRPGTENTPLACAFGHAARKASAELDRNLAHVRDIYEYFVNLSQNIPDLRINSPANSTPYLCNISVPGFRSEILLHYLAERGVYVSSGSACAKNARSHVLRAMGLPDSLADSALRVSFSRYTGKDEIDVFFETLRQGTREIARIPSRLMR